ncbi:MCE family protein [Oculatella sp. LEGE 06141]|uniref:MlaD family protein n=1 Tax=Oculatella sp. LEGE 06141 TaxID=1828648 RepID=UPI0018809BA8|nr:MlaD family protein [Oculatella sp. LEGE 06141]MBE9177387.1 MCE family protein [Oculatella sp. LEGE 06141]
MRSRTIREGSVGLLILVGLGLLGFLILWIRGLNLGSRSYRAVVEFDNVARMQSGAAVRYRGVSVGKITEIRPGTNVVEVEIEIASASVLIPKPNLVVEANQSGLIGETSIEITPTVQLPPGEIDTNPIAADCNAALIVCNGDRLQGQIGVSFDALIRSSIEFTNLFADPDFFSDIQELTRNTSNAAAGVATLTQEVTGLTSTVERELTSLSASASASATSVGQAADQFGLTAAQLNSLLTTNRATLISTLNNLNLASNRLRLTVDQLAPMVEEGEFIQNLETLSANAAEASGNLRNLTEAVGSSENVLLLQQTLDSARSTFQNAQKITADLDELTGDPAFRRNLRDLVDGLSGLVSSTQQLQQQTAIAQTLTPMVVSLDEVEGSPLNDLNDPAEMVQPQVPARLTRLNTEGQFGSDSEFSSPSEPN